MRPNRLLHITCWFGLDSSISSGSFPLGGILARMKSGCKKFQPVKNPTVKKCGRGVKNSECKENRPVKIPIE